MIFILLRPKNWPCNCGLKKRTYTHAVKRGTEKALGGVLSKTKRAKYMRVLIFLVGFMLLGLGSQASAATLGWTLSGAGDITGSFSYNADTDEYSNISLSHSADPIINAIFAAPGGSDNGLLTAVSSASSNLTFEDAIQLQFSNPLTNAGGSIETLFGIITCGDDICSLGSVAGFSFGAMVTASTVPIPAAAPLFGSVLLGGFLLRRYRRR